MMIYDFIIAGAGTAGCLLANKLSKDGTQTVLLIDAGGSGDSFWTNMPAGTAKVFNKGRFNWGYETQPDANLNGRTIYAPRGKGLGGSSLINGMVYLKGQTEDFDAWSQFGIQGWRWDDVLPYYQQIEKRIGSSTSARGTHGPLFVEDPVYVHSSTQSFLQASQNYGIPFNEDINGEHPCRGSSLLQFNIHQGLRISSSKAFLSDYKKRKNLTVFKNTLIDKVVIKNNKATALSIIRNGKSVIVQCANEIILCGGAFGSPTILMRSGVGPKGLLANHGIESKHHLEGVGQNLHDHFYIHTVYSSTESASLNKQLKGWRTIIHGINYVLNKKGPLTMGASQAVAFEKSHPNLDRPDLQINFKPVTWNRSNNSVKISQENEISASCCLLRPTSRGSVSIRSADPSAPPLIHANFLSTQEDRQSAIAAVRIIRNIFMQPCMTELIHAEVMPGENRQDDDEILDFIRNFGASMHHWSGSCRMGCAEDPMAVVDETFQVHGIQGLRVVDASAIPSIPSANTNATTYMFAARAADFILQKN